MLTKNLYITLIFHHIHLPPLFYPSYLFLSNLYPQQFFPLSHSHCTPPYIQRESIILSHELHNKVVKTTYKLSRIPLPSNDVLEIGQLPLECIDAHRDVILA